MTAEEVSRFIDLMTYTDCSVRLYGKTYWCLGCCLYPSSNQFTIHVFEGNPITLEAERDLLLFKSESRDECMKHFLEDKYWDGKSFYEVASDMEWID